MKVMVTVDEQLIHDPSGEGDLHSRWHGRGNWANALLIPSTAENRCMTTQDASLLGPAPC